MERCNIYQSEERYRGERADFRIERDNGTAALIYTDHGPATVDEEGTLNGMEGLFSAILAEDGGTQSEDGKPDQTEYTALSAAYVGPCDSAAQEGLSSFFAQPW